MRPARASYARWQAQVEVRRRTLLADNRHLTSDSRESKPAKEASLPRACRMNNWTTGWLIKRYRTGIPTNKVDRDTYTTKYPRFTRARKSHLRMRGVNLIAVLIRIWPKNIFDSYQILLFCYVTYELSCQNWEIMCEYFLRNKLTVPVT